MWRKSQTSLLVSMLLVGASAGCRQDMHDQLKLEPLEKSAFFENGNASRSPVEHTVARGQLNLDAHLHLGRRPTDMAADEVGEDEGELVETFPFPVTSAVLARGRERYDIYCSPCHSRTGDGDGMVVRRGYRQPPSLHSEKLREAPVGHLYDVIRNGLGVMPGYRTMIPVRDRWAIVAYIRALQLSRHVPMAELPPEDQEKVRAAIPPADAAGADVGEGEAK